jgi:hypothetical protein
MKKYLITIAVFLSVFIIYFAVGTEFTFKPKWTLDYYNPLARSLAGLRLDIPNPPTTHDLALYKGKWYAPWGILPAIFLVPLQITKKGFVPTIYLSVFFASLDASVFFLLLERVRRDFFPKSSKNLTFAGIVFYIFGTTHFYVGTLGSVWHTQQIVTTFFGTLGIYLIFKKRRKFKDYIFSVSIISLSLLGRPTIVFLIALPLILYFWDIFVAKTIRAKLSSLLIFIPLIFVLILFAMYNYFRFENPFNYGHKYINEETYLKERREKFPTPSLANIPYNSWYMLFEIPQFTRDNGVKLNINLKGNSIFFLSPPLLAIFLASPANIYVLALWITAIITILPSLMHYSSGWMQFGYRYSLDITAILVILSIFGIRGKLNMLYVLGIVFSVYMYWLGINALM